MIVLTPERATAMLNAWEASHGPQLVRRFRNETVVGEIDERTVVRWMRALIREHSGDALVAKRLRAFEESLPKTLRGEPS